MSADDEGLRVRVATVLGWTRCISGLQARGDMVPRHWKSKSGKVCSQLPDYLNSLDSAFQLIEHLREKGIVSQISQDYDGQWKVNFYTKKPDREFHMICGVWNQSLSTAICEAFLAVMEPTTEGEG